MPEFASESMTPEHMRKELSRLRRENARLREDFAALRTSPKHYCEQLRKRERMYRQLTETGDDLLILLSRDFRGVYVSPAVETLFGYSNEEFLNTPLRSLLTRQSLIKAFALKRRALRNMHGTVRSAEDLQFIHKNGKTFWATVSFSTLQAHDSDDIAYRIFIRDVSERKAAESQLRKLTAAVDQSPVSIVITDPHGTIEYVNPYFEIVTGYTREEAIGQNPSLLKSGVHPNSFYRRLWETISSGEVWRGTFRNLKKNGQEYWESASISPIVDDNGAIINYIGVKEDITRHVEAEQAIRLAARELEAIVDNTLVGVMMVKGDRQIVRVNQRLVEITGYPEEELLGSSTQLLHVSQNAFCTFGERYYDNLASGTIQHVEYQLRKKDGTLFWCQISGKAISKNDLSKGVIWIIDDITERKKAEQIKEDIERISRHDLKTPLNAVINIPQLILMEENLSNEQKQHLKIIQEAGYRMLSMVNLTLDMYRMEAGTYRIKESEINGLALWRKVVFEHRQPAAEKGIQVDMRLYGTTPMPMEHFAIRGEELLLHSLLSNLFVNAVEAAPQNAVIRVDLGISDGCVEIAVTNPGEVPPSIRGSFFDKYVTHGKKLGTGLGTYSARLIATAHGGDIVLDTSTPGQTTLTVRLPI